MGYRMRNNNLDNHCAETRAEERECHKDKGQRHVHELQGIVMIAEEEEDCHGHRFCAVTGEAIPYGTDDHIHEVCFCTDFFEDHYHEFKGKTGCAIPVGNRHVHYIDSVTTVNDGHRHEFEAATLIDNPTGNKHRHNCLKDYMKETHQHRGMMYDR